LSVFHDSFAGLAVPLEVGVLTDLGNGQKVLLERFRSLRRQQRLAQDLPMLRLRRAAMAGCAELQLADDFLLKVAHNQLGHGPSFILSMLVLRHDPSQAKLFMPNCSGTPEVGCAAGDLHGAAP
jgi:hypothetical protein